MRQCGVLFLALAHSVDEEPGSFAIALDRAEEVLDLAGDPREGRPTPTAGCPECPRMSTTDPENGTSCSS